MNATQLYLESNKPTEVWMCSKCRSLHGPAMDRDPKASANRCCTPYICTGGCGMTLPREKHRTRCDSCCQKDSKTKELRAFEKAKKLTPAEWDGPIFDRHDRFFMSLDDYFDHYYDDEDFKEECRNGTWVWCASEIKFSPSTDLMVENALEEHHEDAGDRISTEHMKSLEDFVEKWAEEAGIISYEPDGKHCVLIDPPEEEADPCLIKVIQG